MKRRYFESSSLCLFLIFLFFLTANGQESSSVNVVRENNKITADENFDLNITKKTIAEADFTASTIVEVNEPEKGVIIGVGVSARAKNLMLILRGISGSVGFRASLESIRLRLKPRTEIVFKP